MSSKTLGLEVLGSEMVGLEALGSDVLRGAVSEMLSSEVLVRQGWAGSKALLGCGGSEALDSEATPRPNQLPSVATSVTEDGYTP